MRFGFWMPMFGGWLRNIEDEGMPASFAYAKKVAQSAEQWGYDVSLLAELYLNDIKGPKADALEAWTTAAALASVTERLELMAAVRPAFHNPAVTAKMAANLDHISGGRFSLNVVSAWWEEEARQYAGQFSQHDERYARSQEFVDVLRGMWMADTFTYDGQYYQIQEAHLSPKPKRKLPMIYAGGESERGKRFIAESCDAYLMHGGTVEEIRHKTRDMKERRQLTGLGPFSSFGMAAYVIVRDTAEEAEAEKRRITQVKAKAGGGYAGFQDFTQKSELEQQITLEDYSVSNRGLRPNLVGTPEQVAERILEFSEAGLDLLLLQCSPQLEELQRFSEQVMPLVRSERSVGQIAN
ncbi:LLM class flavin-dependent oxidoreductase [Alicyclobacillus tolerans]|uniref:FMNH2-dependent dimethyl sulfone monooxygenase n=2 Tax=Alicyclobacillus tolerans TaxID=90970 RepID=A0ABT9LXZ0_9BACL|nr:MULTISPECIES: LLM class flavin-dependent oxidoreductase [Alicyclobacillus]MDP9729138.1 FMNH2-dependent dimethyl sulfone monooxygenase [Alicyclobacillus tengchongensis]QRF22703.1 LLM class flavin-dependent oxidoreductase [Alicyclobacillus sp. TC]SHK01344.1 FMNH2-dependent dimethyl sulfone monooxygenase [Alicyclobacillus montanus]